MGRQQIGFSLPEKKKLMDEVLQINVVNNIINEII